jgi:hypothetical protein
MKFDANFAEAEAIQLQAAILLFGPKSKGISFASVHEPYRDQGGAPYLDAGRPITVEFLRTMARGLGLQMSLEILPETVFGAHAGCRGLVGSRGGPADVLLGSVGRQNAQRQSLSASAASVCRRRRSRIENPRSVGKPAARSPQCDRHRAVLEHQC